MVQFILDAPHRVAALVALARSRIQMQHIGRGMNHHVHLVRVQRAVRRELQHRFLKVIITAVAKNRRDAFALFVQHRRRELIARMNLARRTLRDIRYRLKWQIDVVVANEIGLVRRHHIGQVHLAVLDLHHRVHLGLEITHVVHLLTQLLHTDDGQRGVVDHRRLTHLVRILRQFLLRLRARVRRSRVIHIQLQLPKTENLRVLLLTQVRTQINVLLHFRVRTFDASLVQQILTLRHEFRRVAGRESQQQNTDDQRQKTVCAECA